MKTIKYTLLILVALLLLYLSGPTLPKPVLNQDLPVITGSVENFVSAANSAPGIQIRPGCEAKILWANDSIKSPTEFVLLYLHGFSASRREGYPVNEDFARQFGCNAYLARLASHGLVTDLPLIDMTPERLYESAKEALVVAQQLGKRVIIMGCSTGCTLALKLAADFPGRVEALILYSPNIKIKQKSAVMLSGNWGLEIARLTYRGKTREVKYDSMSEMCKFWYCSYRLESTVYLQQLLDATMNEELFARITCPTFVAYYYKNEAQQDPVVEVKAALRMYRELGTPTAKKRAVAFPEAGNHVLACDLTSGAVAEVRSSTYQFAEELLGMKPVQ